jgi:hypothetical protein
MAIRSRTAAWKFGIPHHNPDATYNMPPGATVVAVLGMHRSGTSAVAGMLEDQGLDPGVEVDEGEAADNVKGTRENRMLRNLNDEVLALNDADWTSPPRDSIRFTKRLLRTRNALLTRVSEQPSVLKDPRMLLVRAFWTDTDLLPIGVVRSPNEVVASLRRRDPDLPKYRCFDLWYAYNNELLKWYAAHRFPIIEFGSVDLELQVRSALQRYDIPAPNSFAFFDPSAVRSVPDPRHVSPPLPTAVATLWSALKARTLLAEEP